MQSNLYCLVLNHVTVTYLLAIVFRLLFDNLHAIIKPPSTLNWVFDIAGCCHQPVFLRIGMSYFKDMPIIPQYE